VGVAEHSLCISLDDGDIFIEWSLVRVRDDQDYCNDCLGKKIGNLFRKWLLNGVAKILTKEINPIPEKPQGVENKEVWITTKEVTQATGVQQTTLSRLARSGNVKVIRKGKMNWLFEKESILGYLEEHKVCRGRKCH
jgi:hypothetical protein